MEILSDLLLPADPDQALEAATKQYVDANAGSGPGTDLWNTAWGTVYSTESTTSQNFPLTTLTVVHGWTGISVNIVAGRLYRFTVTWTPAMIGQGQISLRLDEGVAALHQWVTTQDVGAGEANSLQHVESWGTTAARTFQVRASFLGSTGTSNPTSNLPAQFTVEDIGPVTPTGTLPTAPSGVGLVVCTSTTRPASPADGTHIYETDTDRSLIWHAGRSEWYPPWNTAWGEIAKVEVTNINLSGVTTVVDVPGLSVAANFVNGRRYRWRWRMSVRASVDAGSDVGVLQLTDAANVLKMEGEVRACPWIIREDVYEETAVATAAVTRKIRILRAIGAATFGVVSNATNIAYLSCDDIGPI